MMGFEPMTSSLPRKCSTPELHRLVRRFAAPARPEGLAFAGFHPVFPPGDCSCRSGRRGSNPRPTAWKAVALPTELLPHRQHWVPGGERRIRTSEVVRQQIYSLPHLATLVFPRVIFHPGCLEPPVGIEPTTY